MFDTGLSGRDGTFNTERSEILDTSSEPVVLMDGYTFSIISTSYNFQLYSLGLFHTNEMLATELNK